MIRTQTRSSIYSADDPLALALRPANTESDYDRQLRLKREQDAKLISDRIDEELKQERELQKKRKNHIKLLLLGQAESGKSTLQKQFQLLYAPASIDDERASWRTVVYFNVVRTLKRIIEAIEATDSDHSSTILELEEPLSPTPGPSKPRTVDSPESSTLSLRLRTRPSPPPPTSATPVPHDARTGLARLTLRLGPLCAAECGLANRLSGGVQLGAGAKRRGDSVYVRRGWQAHAGKKRKAGVLMDLITRPGTAISAAEGRANEVNVTDEDDDELNKFARVLENCKDDVKELWDHSLVKGLIQTRKMRLEESSEFFLNNIDRIASAGYVPSTDDILFARLQTMGISQHTFNISVSGRSMAWHIFDVGGARGQRHTWIPYFDDANAIIFIAPVSAFDQYLEEDPRVNRINDSLQLFTQIASNDLLKKVDLVLFLNKTDILKAKLAAGVLVKKYITSYGDRPNQYEPVVQYFWTHFSQVFRRHNDEKVRSVKERRNLYVHLTSVVDTKATQGIITNVQDSIFRGHLADASLV